MTKFDSIHSENITSQEVLHQLEALCTAEEPAACTAMCPLHVDARGMCRLMGEGDFQSAFKIYQKQVPFPLILAYTCNAPCKKSCIRKDYGGAVDVDKLERKLAETVGKPRKAPVFLQRKNKKVAIIGGGVRGMSAAHDLARKGYSVIIYEKSNVLGGKLWELIPEQLPLEVFERDQTILRDLKVKIEYGAEIKNVPALLEEVDGVYIATSSIKGLFEDYKMIVPRECKIGLRPRNGIVYEMFDGRYSGATLDRLFQGVNLEVGREKEGSYRTSLLTNQKNLSVEHPKDEVIEEAQRCIQCKCEMCVEKCGFLQEYGKNPRQYVREVYNNLSIAMGTHHANKMINTCALCRQCEAICPNGLDMSKVFLAAREKMVETKKMPPSAFEFGLLDMEHSMSESHFLVKHQAGFDSSKVLFFPGCQLTASEPDLVKAIYQDLCGRIPEGVGLFLSCCGILGKWAGDKEVFEKVKSQVVRGWEELGKPKILTACPTCNETFKKEYGMEVESLFEILKECQSKEQEKKRMVLHHACGARYDGEMKESVLQLANNCQLEITGRDDLQEESPCCGYGGLASIADEDVADHITEVSLEQLSGEEELPILTYCVNCRDRFLKKGRESWHILEVFYGKTDKIRHCSPTWSERRENRETLKREILRELWEVEVKEQEKYNLIIDEELERKLEKTHILHSDIVAVIKHAEKTKERLIDPENGHFTAYHRPGNVTFWVEYLVESGGYHIYNAYSHRMDFILDDSITKGR
ncbi:NADPH-dependent glutamate synthase beta subunit-like oxidoreductase [Aequitasia blattaphilus]|uniref:FAD-dependent oxidoreductase n=1 Tax=Aequitasia blattaphilus TaxID=2949332 RepID=A0ABT1E8D1_9FIRM|nr:pyridine nucleotide-disulfide oxidoreductase/dicluster-binding protein [Aequitasia blattaphilus]MCP1102088.1 FAD-dependent oxidoreductase [Aequitasia blattaphilus]MCR8614728.1 FAD-dependent oxidoreductase [Aequitasia blattaphilus]